MAEKRHLILGGSGFVGRHVASALAARGRQVSVAGRRARPESGDGGENVQAVVMDMANCEWTALLAEVDVIHHYAWASIPQTAAQDPIGDVDLHIRPTLGLLEAAAKLGGKRIVFASSGGTVYGRHAGQCAREEDPARPLSVYGATKLAVENYMRAYHLAGAIDCRVARLSNPYGKGQDLGRGQGLVSTFVARALDNQRLTIWGDGSVVRDYIHVSDAAEAMARLALNPLPDGEDLPIFNIGSGEGASINEVVEIISEVLGRPVDVEHRPGRGIDVPVNVLCVERARRYLDWSPRLALREGVAAMVADLETSDRQAP